MPIYETLLYGVLITAGVAGIIQLVAWSGSKKLGQFLSALAFSSAFFVGYLMLIGMPEFPPVVAQEWIVAFVAFAFIAAAVQAYVKIPAIAGWFVRIAVAVAFAWLLVGPMDEYRWEGIEGYLYAGGAAITLVVLWSVLSISSEKTANASFLFIIMVAMTGTTVTMMLAGSMKFGQMSVILTSIVGSRWIVELLRKRLASSRGAIPVVSVIITGLIFGAHLYAELPLWSMLLLAVAFVFPWIWLQIKPKKLHWLIDLTIQAAVIIVLSGIAFYLTYQSSPPLEPYNPYT